MSVGDWCLVNQSSSNGGQHHHAARSVPSWMKYQSSPEIHDLMRFQNAIMNKYVQTHDAHFRDMANALTPQIEDKIREFNQAHNAH